MAKGMAFAGVLALAVGAGIVGYGVTRPKQVVVVDPEPSITRINDELLRLRGAVAERAKTLAANDKVRNGVGSGDPVTVANQFEANDFSITLAPTEVVELGLVTPAGVMLLGAMPVGSTVDAHGGKPGAYLGLRNGAFIVTEVAAVVSPQANGPTGYLAVERALATTEFAGQLTSANTGIELVLGDQTLALGRALPAQAQLRETALRAASEVTVRWQAPRGGGALLPFLIGGGGATGLGLLLLAIGLTRRTPTAALAAPALATSPMLSGTAPGAPVSAAGTALGVGTGRASGRDLAMAQTEIGSTDAALAAIAGRATGAPGNTQVGPGAGRSNSDAGAPVTLGPGAVLGRWEILTRLGSGGMADVYKARAKGEAGFSKVVALKVMHPHLARNPRVVELFLDEARVAAQLSHPNVVQIIDLGRIGGDYAITMEFIDGSDLEHVLAKAREAGRVVPLAVVVGLLKRVTDGLAAAHNAVAADGSPLEIVHRDVKAANVLVSRQGAVKVMDFGIAKAASQSHMTVAGETKGTPSMMAPEQRVGDVVDKRADIYSLAAVGYELVTGQVVNLDLAALMHLGLEAWPHLPPAMHFRPDCPAELNALLFAGMAYERNARPASCEAFEAALEQIEKAYGLAATDKDIARWVQSEIGESTSGAPASRMTPVP